jgi:acyl carrier protein
MSELESRLIRCFSSVFPTLTPEQIRAASAQSLAAWDSLAAVTLVAVVQQEFSVEIDLMDLPELDSFAAFQSYLRRLAAPGGAAESQ